MYDLQMPVLAVEPQAALKRNEQMPQLGHLIPNINMYQWPDVAGAGLPALECGNANQWGRQRTSQVCYFLSSSQAVILYHCFCHECGLSVHRDRLLGDAVCANWLLKN
jgi:hypothetical protein